MNWNPAAPVYRQAQITPAHLALAADGVELSYAELADHAARLASHLQSLGTRRGALVGILGSRSRIAIQAVLGVSWAGAAYLPLGTRWPEQRLLATLEQVDIDTLIVDSAGLQQLAPSLLSRIRHLIVPREGLVSPFAVHASPDIHCIDELPDVLGASEPAMLDPNDLVYLIFTSGTTGVPKGVMVSAGSLTAYLDALSERKAMTAEDRASQFTELSFDPSVGEIFVPWRVGASLHVLPAQTHVSPVRFMREHRLSIWGSAPAAIAWMRDTRSLQPGVLSGLRYSSFGGEPLPMSLVQAWREAAPNAVVDNLYGPTEATVDCVGQFIPPGVTPVVTPGRDILAIGTPHPGTELAVLDDELRPLAAGNIGQLAIAGKQLSLGYHNRPELNAACFPQIAGKRWYLTGDRGMQDKQGLFHHLGRLDNQVKVHGHRVELEEIEAHLRAITGKEQVAAIGWPWQDGVAKGIVAIVADSDTDPDGLRSALRTRLPPHMVPGTVRIIDRLPLNASGKLDRQALVKWMDSN